MTLPDDWPEKNARRGFLLRKRRLEGLTPDEAAEVAGLQEYARRVIEPMLPPSPFTPAELDYLERMAAEATTQPKE